MDYVFYAILILIVIFFIRKMIPGKGVEQIGTDELKKIRNDKSYQFVDVRTPGEYKGRHIKQFQNIPLQSLQSQLSKLQKDKPVVVICQSGMRSTSAAKMLTKNGFEKVINVRGGMSAWSE